MSSIRSKFPRGRGRWRGEPTLRSDKRAPLDHSHNWTGFPIQQFIHTLFLFLFLSPGTFSSPDRTTNDQREGGGGANLLLPNPSLLSCGCHPYLLTALYSSDSGHSCLSTCPSVMSFPSVCQSIRSGGLWNLCCRMVLHDTPVVQQLPFLPVTRHHRLFTPPH